MAFACQMFVLLSVLVVGWGLERCEAAGKFSFDVHHMFSDAVKQTLGLDHQALKPGSMDYYKFLAHRDRVIRGRGLASNNDVPPVTFMRGNRTVSIDLLGSLYYANVSVGTPPTWFLVALDTGSDLFWLPCNCGTSCIHDLKDIGLSVSRPLNLYSPNASSTSSSIGCSDPRCFGSSQCSSASSVCPYQIQYLSNATFTSGTLFQDVLNLVTEDDTLTPIRANITLGCGKNQTGILRRSVAVNGLLGLGMREYSVPSILAKAKITADSFSMCFGQVVDIIGRISFGDKGSSDQLETPLIPVKPFPTYVVNVTKVSVGKETIGVQLLALFDTGTSFTHLLEPAYGLITAAFDNRVTDKRRPVDAQIPFEFCYNISPNATSIEYPFTVLTFEGGAPMSLDSPLLVIYNTDGTPAMYCLGILKSKGITINIIGQNFMSGHRIVFDRERMVLGWKKSDCFQNDNLASASAPPPLETEAPSPTASAFLPGPPPPVPADTLPPVGSRNTTRTTGTGGASNVGPFASIMILLLPLLAFL